MVMPFTEALEPEVMRRLWPCLGEVWLRLSDEERGRYGLVENSVQRVVLRLDDELDEMGRLFAWVFIDEVPLWGLDARALGLVHVGGETFYVPDGHESVPV
jgi:hypothetical protein